MATAPSQKTTPEFVCGNKLLGQGSFGAVFRGQYRGQSVAVKKVLMIHLNNGAEPQREQEAMLKLDHSNILKLLHVIDEEDLKFFVLELCAATLEDYCKGRYQGPLPGEGECLLHMAQGLCYIHHNNLVHRDIKPENVLISLPNGEGQVQLKISDFGLCKSTSERGTFSVSGIKGTPIYIAPEILKLDEKDLIGYRSWLVSDVFSLGCTFFYFLTKGVHPFGDSPYLIPANILSGKMDLSKLDGHPMQSMIQSMINSEPKERPKMSALVKQLMERYDLIRFEKKEINLEVNCCQFHPFKPKLACGLRRGGIFVIDCQSPNYPRQTFKSNNSKFHATSIAWNTNGTQLAAGFLNGTVAVWSEEGVKSFETRRDWVHCLQWNKETDGAHLFATGHSNGTVIVWDSESKKIVEEKSRHEKVVTGICWIAADALASCSRDRTVVIHRIGRDEYEKFTHQGSVYALRWNSTFKLLASCSNDKTVKIWRPGNPAAVMELVEANDFIRCLDWHQTGSCSSLLACGCRSGEVLVWEVDGQKAKLIQRFSTGNKLIRSVVFSPDGKYLAETNKTFVRIWSAQTWQLISSHEITAIILLSPNGLGQLSWDSASRKLAHPRYSSLSIFSS